MPTDRHLFSSRKNARSTRKFLDEKVLGWPFAQAKHHPWYEQPIVFPFYIFALITKPIWWAPKKLYTKIRGKEGGGDIPFINILEELIRLLKENKLPFIVRLQLKGLVKMSFRDHMYLDALFDSLLTEIIKKTSYEKVRSKLYTEYYGIKNESKTVVKLSKLHVIMKLYRFYFPKEYNNIMYHIGNKVETDSLYKEFRNADRKTRIRLIKSDRLMKYFKNKYFSKKILEMKKVPEMKTDMTPTEKYSKFCKDVNVGFKRDELLTIVGEYGVKNQNIYNINGKEVDILGMDKDQLCDIIYRIMFIPSSI